MSVSREPRKAALRPDLQFLPPFFLQDTPSCLRLQPGISLRELFVIKRKRLGSQAPGADRPPCCDVTRRPYWKPIKGRGLWLPRWHPCDVTIRLAVIAWRLTPSPLRQTRNNHYTPRVSSVTIGLICYNVISNWYEEIVGGFSQGSPISPSLYSGAAPYLPHFTFIGSPDLNVKRHPNLTTPLELVWLVSGATSGPAMVPGACQLLANFLPAWHPTVNHINRPYVFSYMDTNLPWLSRLVHRRSGAREVLGSNPMYGMGQSSKAAAYTLDWTCRNAIRQSESVDFLCQPATRPIRILPQHMVANQTQRPFQSFARSVSKLVGPHLINRDSEISQIHLATTRSPPTKANRVQSPAGPRDLRKWGSCRTMPLVGGFSRGTPVSPTLPFRRRSMFNSITLIGYQDFAVKSRPNPFTHSLIDSEVPTNRPTSENLDGGRSMNSAAGCALTPTLRPNSPTLWPIVDSCLCLLPGLLPGPATPRIGGISEVVFLISFTHKVMGVQVGSTRNILAERLARLPPTKANRVQSPAGSPDCCTWES
ncbi:hypothetical protein PR048_000293 [Dryococelus australis]|uniref:Uncharacterized protein n=1 Tax=Dryococelus australis TaxID=614101 RepID=A0ABQ9IFJ0_9NEOP|nr:hypothetical protein PR048_000293 [Dryococelus australis]